LFVDELSRANHLCDCFIGWTPAYYQHGIPIQRRDQIKIKGSMENPRSPIDYTESADVRVDNPIVKEFMATETPVVPIAGDPGVKDQIPRLRA
jgi:hypothetical protein